MIRRVTKQDDAGAAKNLGVAGASQNGMKSAILLKDLVDPRGGALSRCLMSVDHDVHPALKLRHKSKKMPFGNRMIGAGLLLDARGWSVQLVRLADLRGSSGEMHGAVDGACKGRIHADESGADALMIASVCCRCSAPRCVVDVLPRATRIPRVGKWRIASLPKL